MRRGSLGFPLNRLNEVVRGPAAHHRGHGDKIVEPVANLSAVLDAAARRTGTCTKPWSAPRRSLRGHEVRLADIRLVVDHPRIVAAVSELLADEVCLSAFDRHT